MTAKLNPAGWVRLALYVISALVGVAAVIATTLGASDMAATLGTIAGAGAAITGGTAVVNLPKAPDQNPLGGIDVKAIAPAVAAIAAALRDTPTKDTTPQGPAAPELPVYTGPTSS